MIRTLRLYPSMLRVGLVSALAYRAEFVVWVLATNLPLVNLALWTAVAREGPVAGWTSDDFAAYFLATLVVRLMTGCWVLWELVMEVRQGALALRLLKPIHPLVAHSAENLAALPMRAVMAFPIALTLLIVSGGDHLTHDPLLWAAVPIMILLAWAMTFLVMATFGSLSFFVESTFSIWEIWLGLFTVFSGYLLPLDLFPPWLRDIAHWLPFRLMLSLPVETMLGRLTRAEAFAGLSMQIAYVLGLFVILRAVWNRGMQRYQAFGG